MTMTRTVMLAALFGSSALATPALAQSADAAQSVSGSAASSAEVSSLNDAQAKIELLQAQVEALQESLAQIQASMAKTAPSWKGAPLTEDKAAGWSFKPRGRIQYDVGYVSNPGGDIATRNLGFNTRARRIRLGAEGTVPGGFGYKFEADFAGSNVGFGDVIMTWQPKGRPFNFTIGNHETMDGLEQITSSRFISFLERGAFNDAFINTRRIGLSAGLVGAGGDLRLNAGLFAAHSIDSSFDNNGWIGAVRGVYSPTLGGTQLHLGANYQHREFADNNGATGSSSQGAPSNDLLARYRARPLSQTTDVRFVDTGTFAAKGDDIVGLEFGAILKSLHVTAEGQYLKSRAFEAGDMFSGDSLDFFASSSGSTVSALVPDGNPSFWGGYVEAGYYLTGETRGYKNGAWDRTKVLKPISKGGWGGLQINARLDYLDLASDKLKRGFTNNFATGAFSPSINLGRGGTQLGAVASMIWLPEDYFRMIFQYGKDFITGGPQAATVESESSKPIDERKYDVDVFAARAQIDF